jgi:hypothetical protein
MFSPSRSARKPPRGSSSQLKSPIGSPKVTRTPDSISKASAAKGTRASRLSYLESPERADDVFGADASFLSMDVDNKDELDIDILKTHLFQLRFLRLKLSEAAAEENKKAESDLLRFWKLVYDAEEEAYALSARHDAASEVLRAHAAIQTVVCDLHIMPKNHLISLFRIII